MPRTPPPGHRRRRVRTTIADPARPPAPHLVARAFSASAPNRLWIGDSTDVATRAGGRSRAVLVDVSSRRVVGWALADYLRTELALDALALARRARRPGRAVQHTDRGSHSTAAAYRAALAARDVIVSLNRAGACLDNALAERCCATLQAELLDTQSWPTRAVARSAIFAWLVVWYHRQRRHSARGYRAPVAYEERQLVLLQDPATSRYCVRVSGVTSPGMPPGHRTGRHRDRGRSRPRSRFGDGWPTMRKFPVRASKRRYRCWERTG